MRHAKRKRFDLKQRITAVQQRHFESGRPQPRGRERPDSITA